jgi:PadR family transcriptional regulator PadR
MVVLLKLHCNFFSTHIVLVIYVFIININIDRESWNPYQGITMVELTRNEELILLSILKLGGGAYGVTIRENFRKITGKTLNYGSLYNTLYLLLRKGLVVSEESEPLSKKGGRRKILYSLTPEGEDVLGTIQKMHKLAWGDVPDLALGKKR